MVHLLECKRTKELRKIFEEGEIKAFSTLENSAERAHQAMIHILRKPEARRGASWAPCLGKNSTLNHVEIDKSNRKPREVLK